MKYFSDKEFACKCSYGCGYGIKTMDPRLLQILDYLRQQLGKPITITSASRCQAHNNDVSNTKNSEHVPENTDTGLTTAVDIKIPDSKYLFAILNEIFKIPEITRIGLNQPLMFIHIGMSKNHPQDVFFKY